VQALHREEPLPDTSGGLDAATLSRQRPIAKGSSTNGQYPFPIRAVTQAFLTLSEVIGHIDILEVEGRVREIDDGGVTR
jgi:hypothetical protein